MSFSSFDLSHDVASIVSPVNEVITVSSSLYAVDQNIKYYSNISSGTTALGGYWQTVYDSAPTSVQSTALFDITFGFSTGSTYYTAAQAVTGSCYVEKAKVYGEMASVLLGDPDSLFQIGGQAAKECFFVLVKRGIMKDELKKGTMSILLSGSGKGIVTGSDTGAAAAYKQTVGGDYAPLLSGTTEIGQVWYNAGIVVLNATTGSMPWYSGANSVGVWSGSNPLGVTLTGSIVSGTIDNVVTGLRVDSHGGVADGSHLMNISFQNQTNLYSTVYFCRATNTEFNYSSNPTYVDASQRIRVTSGSSVLQSRAYITKIGLYDSSDNLLAVGSINKPITKSPDSEAIIRIRLDY